MTQRSTKLAGAVGLVAMTFVLSACGGQPAQTTAPAANTAGGNSTGGTAALSGSVAIDGSSTVAPLTEAAAAGFAKVQSGVQVTVATSGTGGGFKKFCAGETDISDASRKIKAEEIEACKTAGIAYQEVVIANDGLAVVVNPENTWAQCLTVAQLKKIWAPESEKAVTNWNQVDPSFPNQPLTLYGAGTDSGTFDYFTEAINGKEGASRTDYSPSEDDNVTVQGVKGDKGALGYFDLSYAEENAASVKLVQVDGGAGCVTPSTETVQSGEYKPLGRPLFIYVANKSYSTQPQVKAFVDYYVKDTVTIAKGAAFVPLTDTQVKTASEQLTSIK